jgi:alcohol dehydrogenase (cytochrome c)
MTSRPWMRFAGPAAVFAAMVTMLCGAAAQSPAAPAGHYTRAQATRGQLVYIQNCLSCHGARLQGVSGPPLQGPNFGRSMALGRMTTDSLYAFIKGSMPMNAPGSLTDRQYVDVLAYILNKNGYAPGKAELTTAALNGVSLLPFPNLAPNPAIAASPGTVVASPVPASAKVDVDDTLLLGAEGDANDWPLPGRTYGNSRYSPLTQIAAANVGKLEPVTIVHTGVYESFETTPIVVDGIMYLTTPVVEGRMKIMALDAATGATLWTTTYALGRFKICCGPNNRGPALAYGNLYVLTLDDKLLALNARTGAVRWATPVADPNLGYSESMAPQPVDGMVMVGSAGGEWAIRGFVAAYDAQTGKQRWRWYSTDPKTFAGNSWKGGGGTVWTSPAVDLRRGLLIFGTGNPNPDLNGSVRAGINLYTDSIVALDVHTGKLRWYYQEVKHDRWDYDATSNVVLFDVHAGGKTIPAAGQAGKTGWFYIVNRATGALIRRSQPFVLQNKNMFGVKSVLPGANGGSEWSPPAYSPQTGMVYVLGINQLMDFAVSSAKESPGMMHTGSVFTNVQKPKKVQTGTFSAIDVTTGRVVWQHTTPKPMIGGALATGGGLVFAGEGGGAFGAYDAMTGVRLWSYTFVGGVNAPAISYAVNGTQYIAVAAGGNYQMDYERGDAVGIFRLKP